MTKNTLVLKVNENGHEYLEFSYNEATKKSQGDDYREQTEQPILLSQPGNNRCPVDSYKLYHSKLTDIKELFHQVNPYFKRNSDLWFKASPVGENTIGKFMKQISKNASLSVIYTNHCIRGTTATAMHRSGYSLHDIAQVTCHKNIESLKYYLEQPTLDDMTNYSDSLFGYASHKIEKKKEKSTEIEQKDATEEEVADENEDFEAPPPTNKNNV